MWIDSRIWHFFQPTSFSFLLSTSSLSTTFLKGATYSLWLPVNFSISLRSDVRQSSEASLLSSPPLLETHTPFSLMSCVWVCVCVSPSPHTLIHARASIHADNRPRHSPRPFFFHQSRSQVWFPPWASEQRWQWKWTTCHTVALTELTCNQTRFSFTSAALQVARRRAGRVSLCHSYRGGV